MHTMKPHILYQACVVQWEAWTYVVHCWMQVQQKVTEPMWFEGVLFKHLLLFPLPDQSQSEGECWDRHPKPVQNIYVYIICLYMWLGSTEIGVCSCHLLTITVPVSQHGLSELSNFLDMENTASQDMLKERQTWSLVKPAIALMLNWMDQLYTKSIKNNFEYMTS